MKDHENTKLKKNEEYKKPPHIKSQQHRPQKQDSEHTVPLSSKGFQAIPLKVAIHLCSDYLDAKEENIATIEEALSNIVKIYDNANWDLQRIYTEFGASPIFHKGEELVNKLADMKQQMEDVVMNALAGHTKLKLIYWNVTMDRKSTSKNICANFKNHARTTRCRFPKKKKKAAALQETERPVLTPQQLQQMEEAQLTMTQGDSTITTDSPDYSDTDVANMKMMNDVLARWAQLDISHGRGEYVEVMGQLCSVMKEKWHILLLAAVETPLTCFDPQMPALADMYMEWDWNHSQEIQSNIYDKMVDSSICVKVVDLYHKFIAAALIHQRFLLHVFKALGYDISNCALRSKRVKLLIMMEALYLVNPLRD
ncbi:hypothetical protein ARMGADRAFT_1040523 [Armillaria gallica]|uniref:Uncharacterized protein n=1 Tax=Armillaria gallica TaxID=47427 RepID=A0A2H3C9P5_ARMGA|nr:hypothetical protein ARMGADRAFT_1040523 [Armillaria gallica]